MQALSTLHGRNTRGDWSLLVQDLAFFDVGTLNRWALEFDATTQPQGPVVLEEAPGTHIPDDDPAGIERILSTDVDGSIGSVELSVDITHTWISDLRISITPPSGGTEVPPQRDGR